MSKKVPKQHLTNEQKVMRDIARIAEALETIAKALVCTQKMVEKEMGLQ
jgi:hypothetical protein